MIALAPFVERLKAAGFKHVEGELALAKVDGPPAADQALFVVSEGETAEPNRMSGVIDQAITERIAVVAVVRAGARHKEGTSDAVRDAVNRVVDALIGWTHPEASAPLTYTGRETLSVGGALVSTAVRFTTRSHLRRTPE